MFWGLVLEPSKSYAQIVETPFHVSMAALDLKSSDNQEEASTLILRQDNTDFVLANLSKKHKIFNIPLGLDFDVGEEIEFFVQGQSQIHLTGFLAGDDGSEDLDDLNEEEEEDDENELEAKINAIRKAEAAKRKLKENSSGPAKRQKILDESFNDDSDEDDFDVDEDDLEDDEDDDDSDESDEAVDTDDLSEEDAVPQLVKEPVKQQQQQNKESKKQKKQKQKQQQQEKQQQQQQGNKQVNQQQKNQNKTPQKNQNNQNNKTPQKTPQVKTPQGKTPQGKTPQTGNKQQNAKSPQGNVSHKKKKFKAENGHA